MEKGCETQIYVLGYELFPEKMGCFLLRKTPLRVWARGRPPGPQAAVEGGLPLALTRAGARCEFGRAAGRPGRMPPWRPLSASPMTRFGVPARFVVKEDIETDSHRKAELGHLNRPQCKVMLA